MLTQKFNPTFNKHLELQSKIKTVFFVKQGLTNIKVTFNKDAFIVGEVAEALCEIDNTQCDKEIKCVKMKLRRLIYASAKDSRKMKDNITLIKLKFPGVGAKQSGVVKCEMPLVYEKDLEIYIKRLPAAEQGRNEPEFEHLKKFIVPTVVG